jgi:alkanesulfonate monooxygenase SsuD/methylene tetrahydromethanopterin reductase-like flavin-dependent oxidoreductase (luciferase family)
MTSGPPSFGVNLMPSLWDGQHGLTGRELLARRRRLLGRMSEAGLDHVMLGDHVMFRGGLGNDGMIDTASALTANEELAVYLAVYLLVLRHPLLVARQLITVAQLAPGRLSLGVGIAGDDRREVVACGVDPRTRGRRMDEALTVLRLLLAGEEISFDGEFFALEQAALLPVPEAPVPLIVGGRSDAALRRAGRLGDGWLGIWVSARRFAEAVGVVAAHAKDAARPDVEWRHGMTFWCGFGTDTARAKAQVAPVMEGFYHVPFDSFERYVPAGTPADVAEQVAPYVEAGCTTLNFIPFAARDGAVSDEAGIDAVAEVRQALGLSQQGTES